MSRRGQNLILIEDDALDAATVTRAFGRGESESTIRVARSSDALAAMRDGTVPLERRLLVCDAGASGLDLVRALRADEALARTPVLVLAASGDEAQRHRAYELGVAAYFVRPSSFEGLVALVSAVDRFWALVEMP